MLPSAWKGLAVVVTSGDLEHLFIHAKNAVVQFARTVGLPVAVTVGHFNCFLGS